MVILESYFQRITTLRIGCLSSSYYYISFIILTLPYSSPPPTHSFYTLMSAITSFQSASTIVPSSPRNSSLHIPSDRLPDLVSLEHVKKIISMPLSVCDDNFNSFQKLSMNHHRLLGNAACDEPGHTPEQGQRQKRLDQDDQKIFFNVEWTSQSTPVDMGINGYQLDLSVVVPAAFTDQLYTRIARHPDGAQYKSIVDSICQPITPQQYNDCQTRLPPSLSQSEQEPSSQRSETGQDESPLYHMKLVCNYGSSFREPSSLPAPWLIPLVVKTWQHYTPPDSQVGESLYTHATPYSMTWWVSHALSHPSNFLFDRLSVEMMQHLTADEFNQVTTQF